MLEEMGVDLDELTQQIIKILERQKLVSENRLAKRLKLKINAARKLLYRLQSRGLITYVKKRDEKKKWWYLYFWSLDLNHIRELYILYLQKQLERKKQELAAEDRFVFECTICSRKYNYEDALETEFACPQCGELLVEIKDAKVARRINREITAIETELAVAEEERQRVLERARKKADKEAAIAAEKAKRKAARLKKKQAKKPKPKKKIKRKSKPKKKTLAKKKATKKKKVKPKPKKKKSVAKKAQPKTKKVSVAPKKRSVVKRVLRKVLLRKKRK